jgi:hypothetical protein
MHSCAAWGIGCLSLLPWKVSLNLGEPKMNKSGERIRSWKGQVPEVFEPPKHRWQVEVEREPKSAVPGRVGRRTFLLFLACSLGLLAVFVYLLLYVPIKTPLITVAATSYAWPMPPNAWALEDIQAFAALDGKTVRWKDASPAWQNKEAALENLRFQVQDATSLAQKSGALILYLSMHGAVNEQSIPCLIPPQSSPLLSNQWIALDELLAVISREAPPAVEVLVVLDCVEQQVNWHTGMIGNTFVESLEAWSKTVRDSRVSVLCAVAQDQQAWSGPDLGASIFGREFRLGLAGAADRLGTPTSSSGGNGDGAVSLHELVDYLRVQVDQWAIQHRGASQTPQLFPNDVPDFRVGWALTGRELSRQIAEAEARDFVPDSLSAQTQADLWRKLDKLRQAEAYRLDPENWLQLERKLLWLDEISQAGGAYADLASKQLFPELSKRLQQASDRAAELANSHDFFAKSQLLNVSPASGPNYGPLPSLALKELTGELTSSAASDVRRRLLDAIQAGSSETLGQISESLGLSLEANTWTELNFQQLVVKYDCASVWPDRSVIQKSLELRSLCEQLAVLGDVRGHRLRRTGLEATDAVRRRVEDQLFVGASANASLPLAEFEQSLAELAGSPQSLQAQVEDAWGLRDRGLAEISYLAAWICAPATDMVDLGDWRIGSPVKPDLPNLLLEAESLTSDNAPFQREQIAMQELLRLIYGLHDLGDLLASADFDGEPDLEPLRESVNNVQRDLDSLFVLVRDHLDRALRQTQSSASLPRSIHALLQLPFLSAEDRLALHRRLEQYYREPSPVTPPASQPTVAVIAQSLSVPNAAAQSANSQSVEPQASALQQPASHLATGTSSQSGYSQRLRSWEIHPLSALLGLKEKLLNQNVEALQGLDSSSAEKKLEAVDAANARLRRHYLSMLSFNGRRVADWIRTTGVEQVVAPERSDWFRAGLAEHLARAMLPLCPLRLETYSTAEFRKLSLQDMLLWYAGRTLQDFYADASPSPLEFADSQTFFERATHQSLDFVAAAGGSTTELADVTNALNKRLAILGPLSRNSFQTSVRLGPPRDGSDERALEISLQSALGSSAATAVAGQDLPAGTAVAMVRSSAGVGRGARVAVPIPLGSEGRQFSLLAPLSDDIRSPELLVSYRGHEVRSSLFVGQGIVVDFEPAQYDWAEVILFGDRQRQPSIMFVLDCSWSMGEPIPIEAIGTASQSKLELAKDSVLRMVNQLAARPDARLGVRLFGHRLGWSRPVDETTGLANGKPQILPQPNYPETIPGDVLPSNDVEAIVPLGRFAPSMVGGLSAKLAQIVPWGQSPLYLAMIEAFRDFAADNSTTAKSIVVITDGDNFQFNASNRPGGESGVSTTLADVERAWQNAKIPLFILGVGLSGEDASQTKATLEGLATRTGGSYYDVDNGNELLRALAEQLSTGVYQVGLAESSLSGQAASLAEAKLNQPIELIDIQPGAAYKIQFQSLVKSFELQGGESLEMFVREDGQDIIAKPYDLLAPRSAPLVRSGDMQELLARVHRPSLHNGGVTFPISVQDPDLHYTPRPSQWWIEITPLTDQEAVAQSNYVFYDTHYTPKLPVPFCAWHASNWPASATQADVNIWAKYADTPALYSISVQDLQRDSQRYALPNEIPGFPGARLQVQVLSDIAANGAVQIQVTEMHNNQSPGIGSLRVLFENHDWGMPRRIIRRFEPANKIAIHTFEFAPQLASDIFNSPQARIVLSTKSAVLDGAFHVEGGQPIRVEIVPASELLPLEATTFNR